MKQVNVTIWSDFVCPWCWIAKRRLERAVQSLDQDIKVNLEFKSYRLGRGAKPIDYRQAIEQKFGDSVAADRLINAVATQALQEGLVYNFDQMRFGDTTQAHAFVKSVDDPTEQHRLIELLSVESITNGKNIFDKDVLFQLAKDAGINQDSLKLEDKDVLKCISQDELDASKISNGVPLFVFNDKTYLSGAQPIEVFVQALTQTANEIPNANSSNGSICSIDGCHL